MGVASIALTKPNFRLGEWIKLLSTTDTQILVIRNMKFSLVKAEFNFTGVTLKGHGKTELLLKPLDDDNSHANMVKSDSPGA